MPDHCPIGSEIANAARLQCHGGGEVLSTEIAMLEEDNDRLTEEMLFFVASWTLPKFSTDASQDVVCSVGKTG